MKKVVLYLSVSSSLIILGFYLFRWGLIDAFSVFLMPFLWLLTVGFFIVGLVLSIIGVFKNKYWKPLLIHLITILLLFLVPFNELSLKFDFLMKKEDRVEVISMISSGNLQPNVSHNKSLIKLPYKYNQLSSGGGEIVVERQGDAYSVLFFTLRGILDGFSGFIYSPDGLKPGKNDFGGDLKEIDKLNENWYFVVSY
ncbi:hypothetical protein CD33_14815 [Ureibacillus sinduriensis BLB-1 = JCM 15800]|uniref:Uncharacterized protein n=1 Tax=Ureibacillus sinduriensis BLB-1 = JCM 15800 TaxID=1384057 RepID=A0A0A3HPB2_9BACL|nr:hypothetical protein CD33_14815 [Ureibacillus sinduriensis BLB-1 = JCM 15800]